MESDRKEAPGLTAADLDWLAALHEEATPGPWRYCGAAGCPCGLVWAGEEALAAHTGSLEGESEKPHGLIRADGSLIAAARTALPSLLALARRGLEAERLEVELSEAQAEAQAADDHVRELCAINEGAIEFNKTGMYLRAKPPLFVLQTWAEAAMGFLNEAEAPNFREMHFEFRDPKVEESGPPIVVTVQRPGAKSPAVVVDEMRKRAESAESKLAAALAEVERLRGRLEKADTFSWLGADGREWEIHTFAGRNASERAGATWNVCKGIRLHAHAVTLEEAWSAAEKAAQAQGGEGRA